MDYNKNNFFYKQKLSSISIDSVLWLMFTLWESNDFYFFTLFYGLLSLVDCRVYTFTLIKTSKTQVKEIVP